MKKQNIFKWFGLISLLVALGATGCLKLTDGYCDDCGLDFDYESGFTLREFPYNPGGFSPRMPSDTASEGPIGDTPEWTWDTESGSGEWGGGTSTSRDTDWDDDEVNFDTDWDSPDGYDTESGIDNMTN